MCGIIGSIGKLVNTGALDKIKHRGPDNIGYYENGRVFLGHTRLAIQDTSNNANQPFFSNNGKIVIVFNGEIYNHWDIRTKLEAKQIQFKSSSDTETILEGYKEYGVKIIEKLNGIFSLAIYDLNKDLLILTRDRFGVKPLYYSVVKNSLQFSSELKAIKPFSKELDYSCLANYMRFLWSPGRNTPFKEVKKLEKGTILTFSTIGDLNPTTQKFHTRTFTGIRSCLTEDQAVDKLDDLLNKAVERQLLSDVPVGYFLSGGLDSSLLVAIAQRKSSKNDLQCFTINTDAFSKAEGFSNDLDYAKIVANHLDVKLEIVESKVDIVKDFDKMIWYLDEPQADPAPLNVLQISNVAKRMGYKVLIGGTAGDDVFSGYRRHAALRYEKLLSVMPQCILTFVGTQERWLSPSNSKVRRVKKFLSGIKQCKNDRLFNYFVWLDEELIRGCFTSKIKGYLQRQDRFDFFREKLKEIPEEGDLLNKMLFLEMNSFLVDHNLNYTDKMGMAEGVEIRVPYLDNDLVNFSYELPTNLKLKGNTTKYLLKKVAERYLPKEVIYRSKAGFGAPVRKWVNEDLSDIIDERLSFHNLESQGIFDPRNVRKLINENRKGQIDASYSIWAILAIDSWVRQFVSSK